MAAILDCLHVLKFSTSPDLSRVSGLLGNGSKPRAQPGLAPSWFACMFHRSVRMTVKPGFSKFSDVWKKDAERHKMVVLLSILSRSGRWLMKTLQPVRTPNLPCPPSSGLSRTSGTAMQGTMTVAPSASCDPSCESQMGKLSQLMVR